MCVIKKKKTDYIYYSNVVTGMAWDTICIDSQWGHFANRVLAKSVDDRNQE